VSPANFTLHFRHNVLLLLRKRARKHYVPDTRRQLPKRSRKKTLSLATENVSPIALGKGGQQVARRHHALDLREE
jgi:hypothetical protein